ncbi:hypothetical protein [uncultured Paracoccus sp.]|uniref:hypothetical protein n=1 Tax=uncultured Paracoccus sp. TaxID=189685 RepID=UPI0025F58677|nr:hypothetical protein [uncultured Paracoccus sp.]
MENHLISKDYGNFSNQSSQDSGTSVIFAGLAGEMKDALPAARVVVAGLIRPEMKVQVKVTAYRE